MTMIKKIFSTGLVLLVAAFGAKAQKQYTVVSPDKTMQLSISVGDSIRYSVEQDGKELISPSAVSFKTDINTGSGWKIKKAFMTVVNEDLHPVVPQKSAIVHNACNQLRIDFTNGLSLQWRAYNNGIAWRWTAAYNKPFKVLDEEALFAFDEEGKTWYPQEDGFYSHNERYINYRLDTMGAGKLASLPVLFGEESTRLLITESDLFNYAGMWLTNMGNGQFKAVFPHYPKEKKLDGDRDEQVVSREDYIAKTDSAQSFPWRIVMIARQDKDLLDNQLVYQLARPAQGDFSWVQPGKVQWDWWHYNNVYEVDFRAGINNDTYKYYIDFASKYNIPYILLDEGWSDTRDLLKQSKDIDIPALVEYGKQKHVGVLLWMNWLTLDKQLNEALDEFARWGIKGIKVDFMQRDDQDMVNYYERVAKAAAQRKLMVDFHGAYKPIGWLRSYPNVLTSEGVYGNEQSKFSPTITPDHTTTIPFIRMAAGPMDFTPGSMNNVQKGQFAAEPSEPMTPGTRCNQMAMYVIFESPLQMLCDIPTHYLHEPECMQFLSAVPTVWQQTFPLAGKVGEYVAMAREALNGDWYIGAMTNWSARALNIKLDFLSAGKYKMMIWKDGINADRNAKDFAMETIEVDSSSIVTIDMVPGGGYVARLVRM